MTLTKREVLTIFHMELNFLFPLVNFVSIQIQEVHAQNHIKVGRIEYNQINGYLLTS